MIDDYITTYSKIHFTPFNPQKEDISITDIAHALSLMARANGHFKHFYSVAQHSINCALEAQAMGREKKIQLACLLHDASEAYISDITRPVKKNLPAYLEVESKLQNEIYQAFGIELTTEENALIKEIDDAILWHEFITLLDERLCEPEPVLHRTPDFAELRFSDVMKEFLRLFDLLSSTAENRKSLYLQPQRS